uniref:thermonuclease family protein n=1 Tax=uncultured Allobacillus sp. TaxID=1638025 RepID=UPI0025947C0C|nr:thermonuclease family protein [uncultured Allobacillus sp.]
MDNFLIILFMLSFIGLIISLIRPSFIRLSSRKSAMKVFIPLLLGSFIFIGGLKEGFVFLFSLLFLLSLVAVIIGLIRPALLKFSNRISAMKVLFPVFLASFIIVLITTDPVEEPRTDQETVQEDSVEQKETEEKSDSENAEEQSEEQKNKDDDKNDDKNADESKNEDDREEIHNGEKENTNEDADSSPVNEQEENQQNNTENEKESNTSNDESTKESTASQPNKSPSNESKGTTATVTRIVDGDTIEINLNGTIESVRLLLVDTPETVHPSLPVQKFGPEASSFAKKTLSGKKVQVEYDGPKRDKYGRLLAYLWVDGKNFNEMLLREGLARFAYVYDPPYTHMSSFTKAQSEAVNAKRGIWSIEGYVQSDGFNAVESETETKQSNNSSAASNETNTSGSSAYNGPYNPHGKDRNCGDFDRQKNAQAFFEAAGGPEQDPHRLDRDGDGAVCESLS